MAKETLTWDEFRSRYRIFNDAPEGLRIDTGGGVILVATKVDGNTVFGIIDPMQLIMEAIKEGKDVKDKTRTR